jgi:hypothetical protein
MNVFSRIKAAIKNPPEEPEERKDCSTEPGITCRWMEITFRCRSPMGDGEGPLPSGCDANCPARVQNERHAAIREHENKRLYQ